MLEIELLQVALGKRDSLSHIPSEEEWNAIYTFAKQQRLVAFCFSGVECLPKQQQPPRDLFMAWLGQAYFSKKRYLQHREVIAHLGNFYARHNILVMLLKGYGLSLDWPIPNSRQPGDIDIFLFGKWQQADTLISRELSIKIDNSHHHHTVFDFEGEQVENHYDFINVHSHWGNKAIEARFKELAITKGDEILPNIYLPNPNLNALFVVRHCAIHFAAGEMNFRQILDWVFLVRRWHDKIDWAVFWEDTLKMGMLPFVQALDEIAIEYLGMNKKIFHLFSEMKPDTSLANRILYDTLNPAFGGKRPTGILSYNLWMIKRWWANRWKHKIVYKDLLLSTFGYQVVSHLMKPSTLSGKG